MVVGAGQVEDTVGSYAESFGAEGSHHKQILFLQFSNRCERKRKGMLSKRS
jgi:hypothetical protein